MGVDSKKILTALKAGDISLEDAKSELLKMATPGCAMKSKEGSSGDGDRPTNGTGYHRVVTERPGTIDDFKIVTSAVPELKSHQVRIAVKAFSLNFADLLCIKGLYPTMPPYPFTPGLEVSGIVVDVGDAVTSVALGDHVMAMAGKNLGGHANMLTCPENQVFQKPEHLSFEEACALPVVAITMIAAFDKARIQSGEKILIQTATGGTGLMAVQLAKYHGATVFATAGADHKLAYLETMDVPHRINYVTTDFEKEVHRITGGAGVDVVINTLPGDAIQKGLNCLSAEGRYVELAMTAIKSAKSIDLSGLTQNQTVYSINPGRLKNTETIRKYCDEMMRLVRERVLSATVCRIFPFDQVRDAYRYMENRENIGKIIVRIDDKQAYGRTGAVKQRTVNRTSDAEDESVAIIGMSGRFPGADNLSGFWENLAGGKDAVTEVPADRWNADDYFDPNPGDGNKTNCKWGGFLENIDKFDPLFFNISPAEAEHMDPQQRLFLEESWRALEDAGYAPETLSGKKCGVFVGVGKGDYQHGRKTTNSEINAHHLMGSATSILSARISYVLNLTGPSIAMDTACSSSLVAIHLGCRSVISGESEMALAGGVCLLTTEELFVMAGKAGMLSPTGRCRTFDGSADGFVLGEGVGVLVLKSLKQAMADGDCIYGVIRGSGINQDGKTNGITAPSASSQVKLLKEVYNRYAIDPESISYVEAHGTGTKLGDPIEVSALSEVFKGYTEKKRYCAIGSVKTNIGHALAAAGVASVIKVLLALTRKKIPPSLHFSKANEHIDFNDSPFYVNTELDDWKADGDFPLRAVVSSFGFSGTNAHVVIEEHKAERPSPGAASRPFLFVLSAKNENRLKAYADKMEKFIRAQVAIENANLTLADIAYTSQVGRQAMTERLAAVADSIEALGDKLRRFVAGEANIDGLYRGNAARSDDARAVFETDEALEKAVRKCIAHGRYSKLSALWVNGRALDWNRLYGDVKPRRISLPTYPFAQERYWIDDNAGMDTGGGRILHPLLHENTSDLTEQRFSSTFTGDEFFLADHVINDRRILPGVAHLEMARAAIMRAAGVPGDGQTAISLKNVVWERPIIVGGDPLTIHIGLFPSAGGDIGYEVYSLSGTTGTETVVHSRGTALVRKPEALPALDIPSIKAICTHVKGHDALYGRKDSMKMAVASSFMSIKELSVDDNGTQALALLQLPSHLDDTYDAYGLHVSLLNGALETGIFGLHSDVINGETIVGLSNRGEAYLPFSMDKIEIVHQRLPKTCYAHAVRVKAGDVKIFDIQLLDRSGRVLARLKNFAARSISKAASKAAMPHGITDGVGTLHPLIDHDASTSTEQRFVKRFSGDEFYFTDHVIAGKKVLPGVVYLEMARAAVSNATKSSDDNTRKMTLNNVVWTRPILSEGNPIDVTIRLFPETDNGMAFRISTQSNRGDKQAPIHSQGTVFVSEPGTPPVLDIASLRLKCNQKRMGSSEIYEGFERAGIAYGAGHRAIEEIHVGKGQALARLALPRSVRHVPRRFVLHPSLMDAALQTTIGLMTEPGKSEPAVPFALESLEIYGACTTAMWALVKNSDGSVTDSKVRRFDIDLSDERGGIRARMRGFSTKAFASPARGLLILKPSWKEKAAKKQGVIPKYERHMVMLCETEGVTASTLAKGIRGVRCITLKSKHKTMDGRFQVHASRVFEAIKHILADKPEGKVFIQVVIPDTGRYRLYSGLSGLLKTADLEYSKHVGQLIQTGASPETMVKILKENARHPEDRSIRYQDGQRLVERFEVTGDSPGEPAVPWRDKGVYLITGGAGGLGLIFAQEIASRVKKPVLILAGRSKLEPRKQDRLKTIAGQGARVEYRQADVGKKTDVENLIKRIKNDFGGLNGIIHGAGIVRDNLISKKSKSEFKEVLRPKVAGLAHLDDASKDLHLDLFVMFSSGAGPLGNIGQADYACANAFMDAWADYRNGLVKRKKRFGKTLSINWPLWKEGGMRVDKETEEMLHINLGMTALETASGVHGFYRAFSLEGSRALIAEGDVSRMKRKLIFPPASASDSQSSPRPTETRTAALFDEVRRLLLNDAARLIKIGVEKIDSKKELSDYGFDSISLTELTNRLNKKFGLELPPTLLFEYPTVDGFAQYLTDTHRPVLAAHLAAEKNLEPSLVTPHVETLRGAKTSRPRFAAAIPAPGHDAKPSSPVAIVGISGRFPMAENIHAFWNNLKAGKDCITEIPEDRWDWKKIPKEINGLQTTGVKWGGFIDGIRDFDPMFFGISPREAELMDPQQRLMMRYVWWAMEDAGISPKALSERPTGVFISPGMNEYMHLDPDAQNDPFAATSLALSSIPNRISYAFNLSGPSEYCETACSSALVALHRAIVSIRLGECKQAIIGAVNLLLSPDGFIGSDMMGNLSAGGKAKSFQAGADGYVRSEGVGAMIIKPLEEAINDNDHIYAVIKGTGVSHGGRGMSMTAPSGRGMKTAMAQAYRASGIDPATVSYIEAHGTATPMGDAIEINTLKSGYEAMSTDRAQGAGEKMPCHISSLKPCIGHAEIASGMAALIKVVMALNHEVIPGLPGFKTLNENISLKGSRFVITSENREWKSLTGPDGKALPRRAALNSYGFGGVNAHAIIEEYMEERTAVQNHELSTADEPVVFVLSAKNEERLKAYAAMMAEFLERQRRSETTIDENRQRKERLNPEDILGAGKAAGGRHVALTDIAYTLQTGREAMAYRLAMVVSNKEELVDGLRAYSGSPPKGREHEFCVPVFTGNPNKYPKVTILNSKEGGESRLQTLLAARNQEELASYWAKGFHVPWELLHRGKNVRKVSVPVYPFEKRRCWIAGTKEIKDTHATGIRKTDMASTLKPGPDVRGWLTGILCSMLKLSEDEIGSNQEMRKFGVDSLIGMRLINRIKDAYGISVPPQMLLQCETIEKLARYVDEERRAEKNERFGDDPGAKADSVEDVDPDQLSDSELDDLLKQYISDD